jgi:O-antigen/teichoic acid export membrane protein
MKINSNKPEISDTQSSRTFDLSKFGKDVIIFTFGQVIFAFFPSLIIPKYLSVADYGYWQGFLLYASYIGILYLGFVDGILIRWAGKDIAEISNEMGTAFRFLLLELVIIIAPLGLLIHYLFNLPIHRIEIIVVAYAFIMCLCWFFFYTNQALKKFKLLTLVNIIKDGSFLLFILILKTLGYLNESNVILAYSAAYLIILIIMILQFRKHLVRKNPKISSLWTYGKLNISVGIFVALGNVIYVTFFAVDRLMVNAFFSIKQFAIYAFALSIASISNSFISVIATVFFPYISNTTHELQNRVYHSGKPAIILLWATILVLYFPISKLVEYYLPTYILSLSIIRILVCTMGLSGVIQILHVNYYKAYSKQRLYFAWGLTSLVVSVLMNILVIKIWHSLEGVAIVIVIMFIGWYIINEFSLKSVVGQSNHNLWKNLVAIISYIGAFWLAFLLTKWLLAQMVIYLVCFCTITWLLLRQEMHDFLVLSVAFRRRKSA